MKVTVKKVDRSRLRFVSVRQDVTEKTCHDSMGLPMWAVLEDESHRSVSKKYSNVRKSDRLKEEYCRLHHIKLIRIAISCSKIRVMPEQWYRDYISDKLEQIENGGIENWHLIDNIVYMDWTPVRSTLTKNETLNKKCINSEMLKDVIESV